MLRRSLRRSAVFSILTITAACSSDKTNGPVVSTFLKGTSSNHQIGVVVNSTGHALTLFQLGDPTNTKQIALGASNAVTPVGLSVNGINAAVPLGDASSVALVNLNTLAITRFFLFAAGNTTGQAFVDDTTIFAANSDSGYVGRFTAGQKADTISDTSRPSATSCRAPRMTSATDEFVLSKILETISDEDFRCVGIIATDTRDILFLVGLIKKFCPDVQILTPTADLLFGHPSYAPQLRGTAHQTRGVRPSASFVRPRAMAVRGSRFGAAVCAWMAAGMASRTRGMADEGRCRVGHARGRRRPAWGHGR